MILAHVSLPCLYQYISIDIFISICYNYNTLAHNNQQEISLLSKTELEWSLGNKQLSSSYNRKIKSQIRKKIENFENFELPLLLEKGLISLSTVTKFSNGATKFSNTQNQHTTKNDENQRISAQNQSLGRDFPCDYTLLDSRPFPYQGNALPG
jgi:hypothetical protein